MKDFVHLYHYPMVDQFNDEFLTSRNDYSLEELTILCMKEYESIENITLDSYEHITDMDEIDTNEHRININFKKKNDDLENVPKFKYIFEDACTEMRFHFTVKTNLNEKKIVKKILLPKAIDGFYIVNNKKAKAIWQLVDASVYTQRGRITLKSRMPIIFYKNSNRPFKDVEDNELSFKQFSFAMDAHSKKKYPNKAKKTKNKFLNPMMILAAKMGIFDAISFMGMRGVITITQDVKPNKFDKYVYLPLDEVYIKVDRKMFDENDMVRSIAGLLYYLSSREHPVTWDRLFDKHYWVCRVGLVGSANSKDKNLEAYKEKGKTTMMMVERHLKTITIMNLRLPECYKENIYCVFRWLMFDYDELKMKDNIDVSAKRVRKNEYIVDATLGRKISEVINTFISKLSDSRSNDMDALLELFNYSSSIILNGMRNLNDLIKADDITNDMTILEDLAYSSKGPESLGEKSSNNVAVKMRDIHPSFIGVIDPSCTSNSDVGMSGAFVPFVKTYDRFYFSPNGEPDDGFFNTMKEVSSYLDTSTEDVYTDEEIIPVDMMTGEVVDTKTDPRWTTVLPSDTKEHFEESLKEFNHLFNINYEKIEVVEKE